MTVFYVIRPGQTLFNERDRVQGWCDSPLTNTGISNAKSLAEGLKEIPFSVIYTSPCGRAMDTACILAEGRDIEVVQEECLKEVHYGSLEGELYKDAFPDGHMDAIGYARHGGEDLYTAQNRILSFLRKVSQQRPGQKVAVVTHGHIIKLLLGVMEKEFRPEEFDTAAKIPGCSVTTLEFDDNHFSILEKPDISCRMSGL